MHIAYLHACEMNGDHWAMLNTVCEPRATFYNYFPFLLLLLGDTRRHSDRYAIVFASHHVFRRFRAPEYHGSVSFVGIRSLPWNETITFSITSASKANVSTSADAWYCDSYARDAKRTDDKKNQNLTNDYGDGPYFMVSSAFWSGAFVRYPFALICFRSPAQRAIGKTASSKMCRWLGKLSFGNSRGKTEKKYYVHRKVKTTHFRVFTHGINGSATPSFRHPIVSHIKRWTKGNSLTFYDYIIMLFSNCNKTRC